MPTEPVTPQALLAALGEALDLATDGVAVFDSSWVIVHLNPAGAAVLDRAVDDLMGRNMWEVFPEAVGTPFHTCLLRAAASPVGGGLGELVEWSAHYGPVHGWFTDRARRVGDHVVVVYTRADDARQAEATRQRLTEQVRGALARSQMLLSASEKFAAAESVPAVVSTVEQLAGSDAAPGHVALHLPDDPTPSWAGAAAAAVARGGQALFHRRAADLLAAHPAPPGEAPPPGAVAVVPVPGVDGPAGVLVLTWPDERELDVTDRAVLTTLASYAGQALGRVRAVDERIRAAEQRQAATRDAVLELQRTLLPDLPVLPQADLRAVYDAADTDLAAGGDWYDAVRIPDGRLALVVGDVVGHGPAAAAAMAQLRAVGNHLLRTADDPAAALAALGTAAANDPGTRAATALLAVLDLADDGGGRVDWAGCGHPPPLVVPAAGAPRVLETGPGAPLGVAGPPPRWRSAHLDPGDTLLLLTDGLVEQLGSDLSTGLRDLVAALGRSGAASADDVLAVVREARNTDDITVLTARLRSPVGPLEVTVDARPEQLRGVRRALAAWLDALDLDDEDVTALELAVGEAAANAVEHAYRDAPAGPVAVRVGLDPTGECAVEVRDAGAWARPATDPAFRGRGLHLIRSLSDRAEVDATPHGTTVRFARRLRRRPTVPAGAPGRVPPPARREDAYRSTTTRGDTAVVSVHGVVDMVTAEQLRTDLLEAARGGAVPVLVDLDAAGMLGSAGVRVLHELTDPLDLHLRARPGTPARTVIDLVGLAHRTQP